MEEYTDDKDFNPQNDIVVGDEIEVYVVNVDDKGNPAPYHLGLTEDAYKWHLTRCQSFAAKTTSYEWSQDTTEFKNRYNTVTLRLAALIHFIRHRWEFAAHKINRDEVELGWQLYRFFALQFAQLFESRDEEINTHKLMKWAMKQKQNAFTKKQVTDNIRWKGSKSKADLARDALADALSKGWVQYDPQARTYAVTDEYRQWAGKGKS